MQHREHGVDAAESEVRKWRLAMTGQIMYILMTTKLDRRCSTSATSLFLLFHRFCLGNFA